MLNAHNAYLGLDRRAVSVDFGKARQVFFGKSPLTKAITQGAFGVSTKLTMDQVRDAAAITCRNTRSRNASCSRWRQG
jgi:hypothetical protein